MDENTKKRFAAEAKFLRAYFYFDLVRFFKAVPLLTIPVETDKMYDVLQAPAADAYTQIEKDLKEAFTDLPATLTLTTQAGRATKAAAQALLGKVYLQQKKYGPAATELAAVNGTLAVPASMETNYSPALLNCSGSITSLIVSRSLKYPLPIRRPVAGVV